MRETMDVDIIAKDPQENVNRLTDQIFFKNSSSKFQVSVIKLFGFLFVKQKLFVSIYDLFFSEPEST